MPLLLGRASKPGLSAGQRCSLALLGGGGSGSLAAVHAGKHVSIWECPKEGHPGLVLSCCELQSCENYFCIRSLWVKEERDPHAPSHPRRGTGSLPAPSAPAWAGQEGSGKNDLLCAHQAWGWEADFVCAPQ